MKCQVGQGLGKDIQKWVRNQKVSKEGHWLGWIWRISCKSQSLIILFSSWWILFLFYFIFSLFVLVHLNVCQCSFAKYHLFQNWFFHDDLIALLLQTQKTLCPNPNSMSKWANHARFRKAVTLLTKIISVSSISFSFITLAMYYCWF